MNDYIEEDNEASVELLYSFYTLPEYVGLIKDSDMDFLCLDKDEILINNDDHDDLLKLCSLLYRDLPIAFRAEEFKFNELVKAYNKKLITKSIPYFFKNYKKDVSHIFDYKIYLYDEFQRKLIYGILRRSIAFLGQMMLENLTIIRPINQTSIDLV